MFSQMCIRDSYYVVFSNTGMELSDTLKTFVDAQKHWPGGRFKEAKCHMDMEESWNEFGPPASKLRWCCSCLLYTSRCV